MARRHFPLTVVRRGQSIRRRQIWHVRRNGDQETPRIGDSSSDLKQIYVVQSNFSRGERFSRHGHGKLITEHSSKHLGFLASRRSLHFWLCTSLIVASGGTSLWTRILWARAYVARGSGLMAMRMEISRPGGVLAKAFRGSKLLLPRDPAGHLDLAPSWTAPGSRPHHLPRSRSQCDSAICIFTWKTSV